MCFITLCCVSIYMEVDSLWCLQQVCGVDSVVIVIEKWGFVADDHHPATQLSQGRQAAPCDCGGRNIITFWNSWQQKLSNRDTIIRSESLSLTSFAGQQHGRTQGILQDLRRTLNHATRALVKDPLISHTKLFTSDPVLRWITSISENVPVRWSQFPPCSISSSIHGLRCCLA